MSDKEKQQRLNLLKYDVSNRMITLPQFTYVESSSLVLGYKCVWFLYTASIDNLMG